jgi:hypothetical protein
MEPVLLKSVTSNDFLTPLFPQVTGAVSLILARTVDYDGPVPQKLALEDFGIPPSVPRWENADIMYHRVRLMKHQLLERQVPRVSTTRRRSTKSSILPIAQAVDFVTQQREEDSQIRTSSNDYAEWDIYECWLQWRAPNQKLAPRVIAWYHLASNTLLRAIYDFYPDRPFVLGRLLYRDDSVLGYGMCETIGAFQEEVSTIHNQRRDKMTVVNTKVWRVSPTSKLHEGYEIYPSAMVPAEEGEIEPLSQGEPMTNFDIDEEKLSLDLAERRSGVSPPMQGYGAAQQGKQQVSATGTLSIFKRVIAGTDLNISDVRYAHLKIGRIISRQYAFLGLDDGSFRCSGVNLS